MIQIKPLFEPKLDKGFVPAALWNKAYKDLAIAHPEGREVRFAVERPDGTRWAYDTELLPDTSEHAEISIQYAERLVKLMLWAWGGSRIRISGAPEIVSKLQAIYASDGTRAFDYTFMGETCFKQPLTIESAERDELSSQNFHNLDAASSLKGNRIGFDLGGSDRKCAAVIDGEVVFSEEIKWNPYFKSDPAYHIAGIQDSLRRAAAHLPSVDGIGGSAAGIYINNEPRVGSLFRGINEKDFETYIRSIFQKLQKEWNNVPFEVANDGDVTAIAGSMAIHDNAVLGLSMGTSQAGGYINPDGQVTGWLNELAFVPVDYRDDAPIDEWSGDIGCGVQYFSQQAVGRLLPLSGIVVDDALELPEKLELVQEKLKAGDERALAIYETIGVYFGYSIAHYAEFYDFRHLLVLGRVSSGQGGDIIMKEARKVLDREFPELSKEIQFQTPDEKTKRHGQAVAAASLPRI
jgi:predicted NBD/HSP70 family sugar kinase